STGRSLLHSLSSGGAAVDRRAISVEAPGLRIGAARPALLPLRGRPRDLPARASEVGKLRPGLRAGESLAGARQGRIHPRRRTVHGPYGKRWACADLDYARVGVSIR